MRVFKLVDGSMVQIIDKEKIARWNPEMPVIFVNYLLDRKLETYGNSKDQAKIREYLNEILEEVAVPKLSKALISGEREERLSVANNLVEISKKKPDMIKAVLKFLEQAEKEEGDKEIKDLISKVINNYQKMVKRKEYQEKRKKMAEIDKKLVDGKITPEEYAKERKEFLSLGTELEGEE